MTYIPNSYELSALTLRHHTTASMIYESRRAVTIEIRNSNSKKCFRDLQHLVGALAYFYEDLQCIPIGEETSMIYIRKHSIRVSSKQRPGYCFIIVQDHDDRMTKLFDYIRTYPFSG